MAGSNPYFRTALVVCCVAVLAGAPLVGAVTTTVEEQPDEAEVGSKVSGTVLLTDLYRNPNLESWELEGETALTDVTWTVTLLDQGGNQIDTESYDGQRFNRSGIALDSDVSEVRVKVTGNVPPVTDYSYEPQQSFQLLALAQTRPGGTSSAIGNWSVLQYTEASRSARQAIDGAAATIEDARASGASTGEAERTLQDAIEAYETRSFNLAESLAGQAEQEAQAQRQSTEQTRWLLYGTIGVVVVGGLAGIVYWWQNREEVFDRLG